MVLFVSHYRLALVQSIKMCRGIGDPLVAAYARCYICRVNRWACWSFYVSVSSRKVSIDIDFKYREPIELAFTDLCHSFHQIDVGSVKKIYASQKLTTSVYLSLYSPSLDWIVQCMLHKLDEKKISQLVQQTRSALQLPRCVPIDFALR